jgi:hypothetical protein
MDDHYYRTARDMERDVHHYDSADRNGPKIFVGEWASTEGSPTPTLQAALGDAAWILSRVPQTLAWLLLLIGLVRKSETNGAPVPASPPPFGTASARSRL